MLPNSWHFFLKPSTLQTCCVLTCCWDGNFWRPHHLSFIHFKSILPFSNDFVMSPIVRLSFLIVVDSVSGNAITILIKFHTAVCHVWKEKKYIHTYIHTCISLMLQWIFMSTRIKNVQWILRISGYLQNSEEIIEKTIRGLLLKKNGGFLGVYSIQKSQKGERI